MFADLPEELELHQPACNSRSTRRKVYRRRILPIEARLAESGIDPYEQESDELRERRIRSAAAPLSQRRIRSILVRGSSDLRGANSQKRGCRPPGEAAGSVR